MARQILQRARAYKIVVMLRWRKFTDGLHNRRFAAAATRVQRWYRKFLNARRQEAAARRIQSNIRGKRGMWHYPVGLPLAWRILFSVSFILFASFLGFPPSLPCVVFSLSRRHHHRVFPSAWVRNLCRSRRSSRDWDVCSLSVHTLPSHSCACDAGEPSLQVSLSPPAALPSAATAVFCCHSTLNRLF